MTDCPDDCILVRFPDGKRKPVRIEAVEHDIVGSSRRSMFHGMPRYRPIRVPGYRMEETVGDGWWAVVDDIGDGSDHIHHYRPNGWESAP